MDDLRFSSFSSRSFTSMLNQPILRPMDYQHNSAMPSTDYQLLEIVRSATHQTLIMSGNPAYMELNSRWMKASAELEAERYKKRCADAGRMYTKLDFLEDIHGRPVSDSQRRAFSQTVYGLFNELHSAGLDPPTWSKRQATAGEYVCQQLSKQHREFRYCEDGKYKASLYASIKFPDWNRDSRQAGKLAERRRHDTSFSTLPPPAPKRHRKQPVKQRKVKVETDIIDLSLDVEDTESEDHGHLHAPVPKKPSVKPLVSWQTPSPGSMTPPVVRTPPLDIPRSPTPVYEQPPAADHSNAASRAPTLAPRVSRPLTVPHATTPSQLTAHDSPERPLARTSNELLGADLGAINRPPRIREKPTRPRRVDNLVSRASFRSYTPVPRPTTVLPPVQPITAATTNDDDLQSGPSSDSPHAGGSSNLKFPPPPLDARATKKRTPVKPNGSSTQRNLYLTEYLRHHPDTTAQEFKVVWDTLVQAEVKQEYKRLASEAQASN
ncbi:hypothetical protein EYR40_006124 [Pleurotus pulmonarius]|nr:hypothetical protein EYR36_010747 [Pleurotus pulmonarius]KAF4599035.1 hypothetical protein EYR40_006124 [Pleurotus pulmonarius]